MAQEPQPTQQQQQPRPFRFLSREEFDALPEREKLAYINRAIAELEKMDPTRRRWG